MGGREREKARGGEREKTTRFKGARGRERERGQCTLQTNAGRELLSFITLPTSYGTVTTWYLLPLLSHLLNLNL